MQNAEDQKPDTGAPGFFVRQPPAAQSVAAYKAGHDKQRDPEAIYGPLGTQIGMYPDPPAGMSNEAALERQQGACEVTQSELDRANTLIQHERETEPLPKGATWQGPGISEKGSPCKDIDTEPALAPPDHFPMLE